MSKRTTYHHGDLRNALVAAALQLIAEHGVEGFTLRDCAKKAGVSVAAPYRHFEDRDDLLAAVAADCIQRLGEAMDRAIEAAGTVDPLAAFRATGIAYVRFAVEHPAHFRVMYMPQVIARLPAEQSAAAAAWAQDMTARLREAQAAGLLIDLPLGQIMLTASCVTHGLARMIVDDVDGLGSLTPDAAAALAVTVTGVLGAGLLPRREGIPDLAVHAAMPPRSPAKRKRRGGGSGAAVLVAIALGSAHADAKPATPTIAAADASAAGVLVDELAIAPPDGAYFLVGTRGVVGQLVLDSTRPHGGGCPYAATMHLTDAPAWTAAAADHLVVVGPIDPASGARPRLLLNGLARAGHAASEAEEPLGVDPPAGVTPTYAVDLDGDGAADLILARDEQHGRFVHGMADIKKSLAVWSRRGKRWSLAASCRWKDRDTID